DGQLAVGLDLLLDVPARGQHQADQQEQREGDRETNQDLDDAGHSGSPGAARPARIRRRRPLIVASRPDASPTPLPGFPAQTSCSSKALSTARVRSRTPSLLRMLDTWFLIVPSATPSELAISLLEKPEAMSRRISVSRSVSGSGRSRLTNSLRMCSR